MFHALIESNINMKLKDWCEEYITEITKGKEVPKPLDDAIDSVFIVEILKKQYLQK